MRVASRFIAAALVAGAIVIGGRAAAYAASRTTLDGVYTQAQADRGFADYTRSCARCHQPDLNGTGGAPALHTTTFTENWREGYLSNLFHHIQTWMPPQNLKGSLPEQQYLDILTYILSVNEFPAGAKELTKTDLDTILFVDRNGPQPLPVDATIRVVGCLAHGSDWSVIRVGEFPRVHDGSETYEAELTGSRQVPLGTGSYKLSNLDDDRKESDLLTLVGKKVQVKGVLHGKGDTARITVFSFEGLGGTCTQ
jgi:S-disulfanyl-L-cysteine oxidoreductase SoxD